MIAQYHLTSPPVPPRLHIIDNLRHHSLMMSLSVCLSVTVCVRHETTRYWWAATDATSLPLHAHLTNNRLLSRRYTQCSSLQDLIYFVVTNTPVHQQSVILLSRNYRMLQKK